MRSSDSPLAGKVVEAFRELGLTPEEAQKMVEPVLWYRPPLRCSLGLRGTPLARAVTGTLHGSLDDLVELYEEFLYAFIFTRKHDKRSVMSWLHRHLKLSWSHVAWRFFPHKPGSIKFDAHRNAIVLAGIAAANFNLLVEEGPSTFLAMDEHSGYAFGVRDGKVVANMQSGKVNVRPLVSPTGFLSDLVLGEPAAGCGNLYDTLYWFAQERGGNETEALQIALRTLWWRTNGAPTDGMRSLTQVGRTVEDLRRACEQAYEFEAFVEPGRMLFDIFVPQHMTRERFHQLFGYIEQQPRNKTLQPAWVQKIKEGLEEIYPVVQC